MRAWVRVFVCGVCPSVRLSLAAWFEICFDLCNPFPTNATIESMK
jgi:hypothetical protein